MANKPGTAMRYLVDVVLRYEGDECTIWPFTRNDRGYARTRWNGKLRNVCRMICEKVNGPPPTRVHQAAHSCGNGHLGCVTKRHLSWKSPQENSDDKYVHGSLRAFADRRIF